MEKNQLIEITIDDMLDDGRGFGRHEGFAVFIDGGVIGDTVKAKLSKVKKTSAEARLVEILKPSVHRIKAECPYADTCGGCSLQELSYDAQKDLKRKNVISKLTRLAGLDNPKVNDIIGADKLKRYRNKATFAIGRNGEVGFYEKKSRRVIDVQECMLQTETAMSCAEALRNFLKKYNKSTINKMVVKSAFGTGEVMVVLEAETKDIPHIESLAKMLDEATQNNLESLAVIYGKKSKVIAGKNTIVDEVVKYTEEEGSTGRTLNFEIGPQSFYQVNPEQMIRIYSLVHKYAALTGKETVLDLYCGVGTIGLYLADEAERVIGIESVKQAVLDANRNSVINNIINTRYIFGKAEEELPRIMERTEAGEQGPAEIQISKADVAILDPPRAGADQNLLDAIIKAEPSRIVYVSCDAGTLARDIKYLTQNGYTFEECTPIDQFPWTNHVETVVLMTRVDK